MKRPLIFAVLIIVCCILTGCWNYREIESLSIVAGAAIERDPENGDFMLYIEIIESGGSSKEQSTKSKIVESRGKTMFDAARNVIDTSGKRLFWNHAQIIIVSEEVASQGILDVIDWLYRDAEPRLTLHLLVAKDASAKDIIALKGITNEVHSFEIHDKLENAKSIEKYPMPELYKLVSMLNFDVPYAYAPSITKKQQGDTYVSRISGTAIFKGDKLKGYLNEEDTKYFLYVINEIKGGLLVSKNLQDDPNANISLEIFSSKTSVKPVYSEGKITMVIKTKSEAAIGESGPEVNFMDKPGLTALKGDMQEFLEQNMIRIIEKVRNEFDTDIFGFGKTIYEDLPGIWKQYENNWDAVFKGLELQVSSKIEIRNTAQSGKSLKGAE